MPDNQPTAKPSRKIKLLVVCASIVVALCIAEIALRVVGYTYPVFYSPDAARGYALRPCMQGWYRKEGVAYVRINCAGLRDREHALAKPPGTLRIAVVGDSYAEALQVPVEDAFWRVMEQRLQSCPAFGGRNVEVINFGVSGYGTTQELITLEQQVWAYAPDVVLLAITTNNDITDNSRPLKRTDEIPYFVLRDGQLALDDSFRQTPAFRLHNSWLSRAGRWLNDHLRVVQGLQQAHRAFKYRFDDFRHRRRAAQAAPTQTSALLPLPGFIQSASSTTSGGQGEELGTDILIYRPPPDQVWQDAWRVTEALLLRMRDEVNRHGAQFVVVTLSNGIQVYPDKDARQAFAARLGVPDLLYPDTRIKTFCEQAQIPALTLAPQLQAYADQHKVFLHGFDAGLGNGHWNQTGHHVAGELLAQQLCAGLIH